MKTLLRVLGIAILFSTMHSCTVQKSLDTNFYSNEKKIGIVYVVDSIDTYKQGSQGLLDMAVTAGARFKKPLQVVDTKVNPKGKIKNMYNSLFVAKGKSVKEYEVDQDAVADLQNFDKPTGKDKKYFKYDLTHLKKDDIDELLIVNVRYGLLVSYYGMIETGKQGYCQIDTNIVNLEDNSLLYADVSVGAQKIKGKWKTPPAYESLTTAVSKAIDDAVAMEREKLNK